LHFLDDKKYYRHLKNYLPNFYHVIYFQKITNEVHTNMTISTKEVLNLRLDAIKPNPYQPRRIFDPNRLDELAASIKVYGVLQPITVRLMGSAGYELVAGERRLRASRIAGVSHIPAILIDITDTDSAIIAMIENLQRSDLHFFEEAEGLRNLMSDYAFTQEALAAKVGKTQSTVANKLRLLKIPRALQKAIIENELTERHTRAMLRLENEAEQANVLEKIIANGLTVRKTEDLIEAMLVARAPKSKNNTIPFKAYIRDIRILTNSIKEDLEVIRHSGLDTHFDIQETSTGYSIQITLDYAKKIKSSIGAKKNVI